MADLNTTYPDPMKVVHSNSIFRQMDKVLDYVPVVSTATNLIDIFNKAVAIPLLLEVPYIGQYLKSNRTGNSYTYYVQNEKSFLRCFLLLIPILGNLIYGIYDSIPATKRPIASKEKEAELVSEMKIVKSSNLQTNDALVEVVVSDDEHAEAESVKINAQKPIEVIESKPCWQTDFSKFDFSDQKKLHSLSLLFPEEDFTNLWGQ